MHVLTLHGFTGNAHQWQPITRGTHQTLLGHGAAASLATANTFDGEIHRLGGDLKEPTHLMGYSMGARVALGLALHHPKHVAKLTLVGVHPGLQGPEQRRARIAADRLWIERLRMRGIESFVAAWEKLPLWQSQSLAPQSSIEAQRETRLSHDARELARALEVLGLGNMTCYQDRLHELKMQVHLICGALDQKFSALAKDMLLKIPNATCTLIPNVGHNVLLEAPSQLRAAIFNSTTEESPP